ncbi:hypothetical protein QE152_g35743, partial [Popillia japonica]
GHLGHLPFPKRFKRLKGVGPNLAKIEDFRKFKPRAGGSLEEAIGVVVVPKRFKRLKGVGPILGKIEDFRKFKPRAGGSLEEAIGVVVSVGPILGKIEDFRKFKPRAGGSLEEAIGVVVSNFFPEAIYHSQKGLRDSKVLAQTWAKSRTSGNSRQEMEEVLKKQLVVSPVISFPFNLFPVRPSTIPKKV